MGMRGEEAYLIFNPAADKGRAARRKESISRSLKERGIEAIWRVTEGPGHAGQITASLPDDALAVAVGGDGTVHEVASACIGTNRLLGVLPVGSGNDYVKALGMGTKLEKALEALAEGRERTVDAGEVNGVRFNNGLGIGFDAEVAEGVSRAPVYLSGVGRYLWSVGRLLWGFRCHEATLKLDGKRVVETKTILIAAALGTTYGARFKLAPEARLDDGLFDVLWSEEVSRAEVLRLIPAALGGTLLKQKKVHLARVKEVEVDLAEEVPAHVDGEMLSPTRYFQARVLPGALRVLAP
jgi:diacylglycerol kinase (ATP)